MNGANLASGDATEAKRTADAETGAVVVPVFPASSCLACIRSLGRRGVDVIAAAQSPDEDALRSKYLSEATLVPNPETASLRAYGDALLELAERDDVCTIVPLREPDIFVLAERREEFAERVETPWPPRETVEKVRDRLRLFEIAAEVGVPTPKTASLDRWEAWDEDAVVKPRYTVMERDGRAFYSGVQFVTPDDDLDYESVVAEMGHVPMVQEYVPGDAEHGFFALYDRGDPVAKFQHGRVRSWHYAGGASVFREAVAIPELERAGTRLLSALDWHGPAMVEFKRDPRDGRFKLMEVNPRFWGSLPLAIRAGVDFPYRYYQLARGEPFEPDVTYDEGVACHNLVGEISYLNSVLRDDYEHVERPSMVAETATVLASLVRHPDFDYLSLDDPAPLVQNVRNAAGGPLRSASAALGSFARKVGTDAFH